jgi:ATP-dependent Clp protease protease subunit
MKEERGDGPIKVWVNEFDDETVKRVLSAIDDCTSAGQSVLPLYINSSGGALYAAFAMIDAVMSADIAVATIAVGNAQSAAVDLLSAGTPGHRYVGPNAVIMVHDSGDCQPTFKKNNDYQAYARQAQRERDISFEVFAKNTKKTKKFWDDWLDARKGVDVFLTAKEAVELGIADHIGIPQLNVVYDVELVLPSGKR